MGLIFAPIMTCRLWRDRRTGTLVCVVGSNRRLLWLRPVRKLITGIYMTLNRVNYATSMDNLERYYLREGWGGES